MEILVIDGQGELESIAGATVKPFLEWWPTAIGTNSAATSAMLAGLTALPLATMVVEDYRRADVGPQGHRRCRRRL